MNNDPLTRQQFPDTPLERLRQIGDPSVPFYQQRLTRAALTHMRPWERMKLPLSQQVSRQDVDNYLAAWQPLLVECAIDPWTLSIVHLTATHSLEGWQEVNRALWHLLKQAGKGCIERPNKYLARILHECRNWLDRPPYNSDDWLTF